MPRRVLLDTDLGTDVDDAWALALALASPEIELVGVTTVGRDSALQARIAVRLLRLAGCAEVPVFAGCRVPVLGASEFIWLGHEGEGILAPGEPEAYADEHAVDALLRLTAEQPTEIVAIGPLTNLAVALMKDPDLAARVPQITLMGGHLREIVVEGRVLPFGIDYNLCADPEGAQRLLCAGVPTRLVTADVTMHTWLGEPEVERLEATGHPLHAALARATRIWSRLLAQRWGRARAAATFLHDPLTLCCCYDESYCRFEELEIEARIEERRLRTAECSAPTEESQPLRCAVSVDAEGFRAHLMERVLSLGATGS